MFLNLLADGDLYYTIAQLVNSDVNVQTWGVQRHRKSSYCSDTVSVYNIKTINTDVGKWDTGSDHSKWCVTRNVTTPWTCIADVNRASSQYTRRGGALCINDERITSMFLKFVKDTENCTTPITQICSTPLSMRLKSSSSSPSKSEKTL